MEPLETELKTDFARFQTLNLICNNKKEYKKETKQNGENKKYIFCTTQMRTR
jgi:hypothetical protein